tara:strand:- start:282 stop:2558 length:2277 start_codon:yes stop_codon:yes gene_type:complete
MVRMAQPFSMRVPLVDGQGNFGSIDGDSPAAMRYTESRMTVFSEKMFEDIEKDTVDMLDNYDGTEKIPESLPLRFPNLLINGSEGIAVAMATSMPCHNPIEVLNAVMYLLDNNLDVDETHIDELLKLIPAPDFPTGGVVHNLKEMKNAWLDGYGSMRLRAKWQEEEDVYGNPKIVITEIPYQVEKESLIKKISALGSPDKNRDGFIDVEGIKSVQDYSSREGVYIEIVLKKGSDPESVFNKLAKMSRLEVHVNYNNTVLVNNRPVVLGILDLLKSFIHHRESVVTRRTEFLLKKSKARQHILKGLIKALSKLDTVIELIKNSKSNASAKQALMDFLNVDETQAESILRMQLRSLNSSEVSDLENEFEEINKRIERFNLILGSKEELRGVIRNETLEQIELFSNTRNAKGVNVYSDRQTEYVYAKLDTDLAALTKSEESVVFFSRDGFIRRMPREDVQSQNRGTRGRSYMKLSKGDSLQNSILCHSHDIIMFVSNKGQVYSLYAYEINDVERGRHINNILEVPGGEEIRIMLSVNFENEDENLIFVTKNGIVKKTRLADYKNSFRKTGLKGLTIRDKDDIKFAKIAKNGEQLVLGSKDNKVIRFVISEDTIRTLGRTASGVKGMDLGNSVIADVAVIPEGADGQLVSVTEKGMIKVTDVSQYRTQSRGGKGLSVMKANERTGDLFKIEYTDDLDKDVVVTNSSGYSNRIDLSNINKTNRFTSGVKLVKVSDGDSIISVSIVDRGSEVEEEKVEELEEAN